MRIFRFLKVSVIKRKKNENALKLHSFPSNIAESFFAAACKNGEQCEVVAEIGEGNCKVPGLEADLSASGKILKVESVKKLGSKK